MQSIAAFRNGSRKMRVRAMLSALPCKVVCNVRTQSYPGA